MAADPEMREVDRRKLNITEGLILAALIFLGGLIFRLNDSVTRLQVAAESTNAQIAMLQSQLANVPGLSSELAEVKVQVKRNTDDITELRGMKGLK